MLPINFLARNSIYA